MLNNNDFKEYLKTFNERQDDGDIEVINAYRFARHCGVDFSITIDDKEVDLDKITPEEQKYSLLNVSDDERKIMGEAVEWWIEHVYLVRVKREAIDRNRAFTSKLNRALSQNNLSTNARETLQNVLESTRRFEAKMKSA